MNSEKVILVDEAIEDLEVGSLFYNSQRQGIGNYFVSSLLTDVASLEIYAGIHSIHYGYHRMLSQRFPFAVYYEIVLGISRVVAVLDMRQDPDSIQKILQQRRKKHVK